PDRRHSRVPQARSPIQTVILRHACASLELRWPDVTPARAECGWLSGPDVLAPRSFRSLPFVERHRLSFAQFVERRARARGLVKEVLTPVFRCDEPEPLGRHQPLDGALRRSHVASPSAVAYPRR